MTVVIQLNSIVRSHSHKPHWRVIRDLYIINSSQSHWKLLTFCLAMSIITLSTLASLFQSGKSLSVFKFFLLRLEESELSDF